MSPRPTPTELVPVIEGQNMTLETTLRHRSMPRLPRSAQRRKERPLVPGCQPRRVRYVRRGGMGRRPWVPYGYRKAYNRTADLVDGLPALLGLALTLAVVLTCLRWCGVLGSGAPSPSSVGNGPRPSRLATGSPPASAHAARTSACGASSSRPPAIEPTTWAAYRCLSVTPSAATACLLRPAYSQARGEGCPGDQLCCPPSERSDQP
jgi:hypothetical protein